MSYVECIYLNNAPNGSVMTASKSYHRIRSRSNDTLLVDDRCRKNRDGFRRLVDGDEEEVAARTAFVIEIAALDGEREAMWDAEVAERVCAQELCLRRTRDDGQQVFFLLSHGNDTNLDELRDEARERSPFTGIFDANTVATEDDP